MGVWFARLIGSVFGIKGFMGGLLMTIIAVVLYNLFVTTITEIMNFSLAQISGSSMGSVSSPTISGFAGWFLAQLKVPECVSVIGTTVALRFGLRKIPFLKW